MYFFTKEISRPTNKCHLIRVASTRGKYVHCIISVQMEYKNSSRPEIALVVISCFLIYMLCFYVLTLLTSVEIIATNLMENIYLFPKKIYHIFRTPKK